MKGENKNVVRVQIKNLEAQIKVVKVQINVEVQLKKAKVQLKFEKRN